MKRKMIGAAAAYMSGLFFASFFTEGSDFLLLAILLPVFFVLSRFFFKLKISTFVIHKFLFINDFITVRTQEVKVIPEGVPELFLEFF